LEHRENNEKEIRQLNLELEERIGDVQERTAQLEIANKALESFSYSISHDLKAPLRAISGFSSILLEDLPENTSQEAMDNLHRIIAAVTKMDSMINGMLDLAEISRESIQLGTVDISEMVKDICRDLPSRDPGRETEILVTDGIQTQGDERLLRILLQNLIDNAWKFTRDNHRAIIEFSLIKKDEEQIFFVRDNGVGFDSAYAEKLFTPFQRLHSEADFKGHGIGLATCERIVRKHSGRIWAEAEPGKGATFFFTLSPR
jgi:light-regulated signal transduction histidine kinase (bacteriophytochrome)